VVAAIVAAAILGDVASAAGCAQRAGVRPDQPCHADVLIEVTEQLTPGRALPAGAGRALPRYVPAGHQERELRADDAAGTRRPIDAGAAVDRSDVQRAADERDQAPAPAKRGVPAFRWRGAEIAVVERAARLGDLEILPVVVKQRRPVAEGRQLRKLGGLQAGDQAEARAQQVRDDDVDLP
jgi:hypothetical protein